MVEAEKLAVSVLEVNAGASQPSVDASIELVWTCTHGPRSSGRAMPDSQQEGMFPREVLQLWEVRPHGQGLPPTAEEPQGLVQCHNGG